MWEWGAWGGFGGRAGGIKNGLRLAVRRKMGLGRARAEEGPDGAAPGGHASQGPFLNSCRQGERRILCDKKTDATNKLNMNLSMIVLACLELSGIIAYMICSDHNTYVPICNQLNN